MHSSLIRLVRPLTSNAVSWLLLHTRWVRLVRLLTSSSVSWLELQSSVPKFVRSLTFSAVSWFLLKFSLVRLVRPETSSVPVRDLFRKSSSVILLGLVLLHVAKSHVTGPSFVADNPLFSMIALIATTSPSW